MGKKRKQEEKMNASIREKGYKGKVVAAKDNDARNQMKVNLSARSVW